MALSFTQTKPYQALLFSTSNWFDVHMAAWPVLSSYQLFCCGRRLMTLYCLVALRGVLVCGAHTVILYLLSHTAHPAVFLHSAAWWPSAPQLMHVVSYLPSHPAAVWLLCYYFCRNQEKTAFPGPYNHWPNQFVTWSWWLLLFLTSSTSTIAFFVPPYVVLSILQFEGALLVWTPL